MTPTYRGRVTQSTKPAALFVYGAFKQDGGGLGRMWYQRLTALHDAGWDIHIGLIDYRRYRTRALLRILGGKFPSDVTVHTYWHSQMSRAQSVRAFARATTKFIARKLLLKKIARDVTSPLHEGVNTRNYFDRLGRLTSSETFDSQTHSVNQRTWFDTDGSEIVRKWFTPDMNETFIQRPSDLERHETVSARATWLSELPLPDGTIVFADSPYTYSVVAQLPQRWGKIFVLHLNHLKRKHSALGELTSKMERDFNPFVRFADAIVTATADQAEDLEKRYGNTFHFESIRPVVDFKMPSHKIARNRHRIVMVCRLVDVKRVHHMLSAMPLIMAVVPDAQLDIWGTGDDEARLKALALDAGLTDSVKFCGYTTEPEKVFRQAGVSVLTSQREAYGLAVTESLLQGCPVVSYNIKYGPSEVITDGLNGILIEDGKIGQLADAIISILTNPELQDSMSHEAAKVHELVDREHFQQEWVALAEQISGVARSRVVATTAP